MYKIHSGGAKRPHPAEGGAVDFVNFFVDFPCAVCGFPAYLPAYIRAYYVHIGGEHIFLLRYVFKRTSKVF